MASAPLSTATAADSTESRPHTLTYTREILGLRLSPRRTARRSGYPWPGHACVMW
ncbi:hypothetical protein ACFPRL_07575 [Pseudoclavibacter helvolus]